MGKNSKGLSKHKAHPEKEQVQKLWGSVVASTRPKGWAKKRPPAVWSHRVLAHGNHFAFPKNEQNSSEVASDYNSAYVFSLWKHSETIGVKGIDKTPTCTHASSYRSPHIYYWKSYMLQNCPVTAPKAKPICFPLLFKELKNPSPLGSVLGRCVHKVPLISQRGC